ncbi:LutC/YkgG family protein [Trueperella bialowiezensis]|uniref:Uncharacterized ACR, YkgG family COG1556 n=1 Tax=Trueperella bialowiezensis TaxID=312285 RepID=A0A3S4VF25_9ACTO|nr:lactate utilization protein C [Trueperella bialowiezensis]VEI12737.1 Uncharacterised ACR, YkgG family COG1556 [Trueperella bialowiezensis]
MGAREEIFARIDAALADVTDPDPEETPVDWEYGLPTDVSNVVELFLERVADYRAEVEEVQADDVPEAVVRHLRLAGAESVVLPAGLEPSWREAIADAGITIHDDDGLTARELNEIDAVVTAAALGIAETGTFVMDHRPDQGRRALTLVPDVHVCVVRKDQVVTDLPEAMTRLKPAILEGQPLTYVSGPSATSDIELNRVEGVHGPRILHVIVAD